MAATPNVTATTRDLWEKTVRAECWIKNLLFNLLARRHRVKFPPGILYKANVESDDIESLGQDYTDNTPLTSGSKTIFVNPKWERKRSQIPVKLTEGERDENAPGADTQIVSLPEAVVANAQKSMRKFMNTKLYGVGTDTGIAFQGLRSALTHDVTYGTLDRATTVTNKIWQGASIDDTYADNATAYGCSINTVRRGLDAISKYQPDPMDTAVITSLTNWRTLQAQVDPSRNTPPGDLAKYGFRRLDIDGVNVFGDPYLEFTSATTKKYMFILNLPDWFLLFHGQRGLGYMTDFFDQSKINNGISYDLARIKVAGNFVCKRPNGSLFLSNIE